MAHVCAYACPIAAPIWPMYARMHAPLLLLCGPCMPPYMAIYARMYAPLSGTKIRTIRKAVKKRQALYLIWTSLLALAIYSKSSNGPCMRACMPHCWPHIWPIAALVYGPFLPVYMAYCSAHAWAVTALVQIRYKAWRFLTAFLIVLIFVPLNGAYMRAHIGHI